VVCTFFHLKQGHNFLTSFEECVLLNGIKFFFILYEYSSAGQQQLVASLKLSYESHHLRRAAGIPTNDAVPGKHHSLHGHGRKNLKQQEYGKKQHCLHCKRY